MPLGVGDSVDILIFAELIAFQRPVHIVFYLFLALPVQLQPGDGDRKPAFPHLRYLAGDGADLPLPNLQLLGGGIVEPAGERRTRAVLGLEGHRRIVIGLGLHHRAAVVICINRISLRGHDGKDIAVLHELPHGHGPHLIGFFANGDLRFGPSGPKGKNSAADQNCKTNDSQNRMLLFHTSRSSCCLVLGSALPLV